MSGATVPALSLPVRLFLLDGRPAEKCWQCGGTGYLSDPSGCNDRPCPARCEDGRVPMVGQAAVVALLDDVLYCIPRDGDGLEWLNDIANRVRAAKELIEDMSVTGGEVAPEPWR